MNDTNSIGSGWRNVSGTFYKIMHTMSDHSEMSRLNLSLPFITHHALKPVYLCKSFYARLTSIVHLIEIHPLQPQSLSKTCCPGIGS